MKDDFENVQFTHTMWHMLKLRLKCGLSNCAFDHIVRVMRSMEKFTRQECPMWKTFRKRIQKVTSLILGPLGSQQMRVQVSLSDLRLSDLHTKRSQDLKKWDACFRHPVLVAIRQAYSPHLAGWGMVDAHWVQGGAPDGHVLAGTWADKTWATWTARHPDDSSILVIPLKIASDETVVSGVKTAHPVSVTCGWLSATAHSSPSSVGIIAYLPKFGATVNAHTGVVGQSGQAAQVSKQTRNAFQRCIQAIVFDPVLEAQRKPVQIYLPNITADGASPSVKLYTVYPAVHSIAVDTHEAWAYSAILNQQCFKCHCSTSSKQFTRTAAQAAAGFEAVRTGACRFGSARSAQARASFRKEGGYDTSKVSCLLDSAAVATACGGYTIYDTLRVDVLHAVSLGVLKHAWAAIKRIVNGTASGSKATRTGVPLSTGKHKREEWYDLDEDSDQASRSITQRQAQLQRQQFNEFYRAVPTQAQLRGNYATVTSLGKMSGRVMVGVCYWALFFLADPPNWFPPDQAALFFTLISSSLQLLIKLRHFVSGEDDDELNLLATALMKAYIDCSAADSGFNGIKAHMLLHLLEDMLAVPCLAALSTVAPEARMRVLGSYIAERTGTVVMGQSMREGWLSQATEYELLELLLATNDIGEDPQDADLPASPEIDSDNESVVEESGPRAALVELAPSRRAAWESACVVPPTDGILKSVVGTGKTLFHFKLSAGIDPAEPICVRRQMYIGGTRVLMSTMESRPAWFHYTHCNQPAIFKLRHYFSTLGQPVRQFVIGDIFYVTNQMTPQVWNDALATLVAGPTGVCTADYDCISQAVVLTQYKGADWLLLLPVIHQ